MKLSPELFNTLIRSRRAVFPNQYNKEPITDAELMQILENARWAPTHKLTEPWRFIVFREDGLKAMSSWLSEKYRARATEDGDYSEAKEAKFRDRPLQCSSMLGICMRRDPAERVPEWEELASVACAVQNIWLSCTAYGIGCYWSTPNFVVEATDLPGIEPDWTCLGLFYMGKWDIQELPSKRTPLDGHLKWVRS